MTAEAALPRKIRRKGGGFLTAPFAILITCLIAAAAFVAYVLWPTWSSAPVALDAPAIPITVADVLFEVPPATVRAAVQRHPGPHERIDLAFLWPALQPPRPDAAIEHKAAANDGANDANRKAAKTDVAAVAAADRLFVTISPLGAALPPADRLRDIYPRYVEATASTAGDGLAVVPFRAGTPYQGEDLVYVADAPDRFFARCTPAKCPLPGTCIAERVVGAAEITLRFPRDWLRQWREVAASFDRLIAALHPQER